jgi:hypothetical protein
MVFVSGVTYAAAALASTFLVAVAVNGPCLTAEATDAEKEKLKRPGKKPKTKDRKKMKDGQKTSETDTEEETNLFPIENKRSARVKDILGMKKKTFQTQGCDSGSDSGGGGSYSSSNESSTRSSDHSSDSGVATENSDSSTSSVLSLAPDDIHFDDICTNLLAKHIMRNEHRGVRAMLEVHHITTIEHLHIRRNLTFDIDIDAYDI